MSKYIMMSGVAGSGKSTVAKRLSEEYGAEIISSDEIRKELWGSEEDQQHPEIVFALVFDRIKRNLKEGKNVILDATNIKNNTRNDAFFQAKGIDNVENILVVLDRNINTCIRQNKLRERKVPETVILKQYNRFEEPSKELIEKYNVKVVRLNEITINGSSLL